MTGLTATCRALVPGWTRQLAMMVLLGVCSLHLPGVDVITYNSTNVPVAIPEIYDVANPTAGPADSTLVVSGMFTSILKVTVSVYIVHEFTSDLRLVLTAPDGTAVTLANGVGGNNRTSGFNRGYGTGPGAPPNGRVVFDDEAAVSINTEATTVNNVAASEYILSGTWRPQQNLAAFNNLSPAEINGTWVLLVDDEAAIDIGSIRAWSISFTIPGAHIWTGAVSNLWNVAGNWQNDNIPVFTDASSVLIFPNGGLNTNTVNNLGDMRCSSIAMAGGYSVTGNKITMTANSTFAATDGTTTDIVLIQNDGIDLAGVATFTVDEGVTLDLDAVIANDAAVAGAPTFTGAGTTLLREANLYTGATTISGLVALPLATSTLGTVAGGTTVTNGGTLRLDAAITTTEALSLAGLGVGGQGALATTVVATWGGPVTLSGTNTGFGAAAGTLTISDMAVQAAGTYGFTAIGPGAVVLGDALPTGTILSTDGSLLTLATVDQPGLAGLTIADDGDINAGGRTLTVAGSVVITGSTSALINNGTVAFGGTRRSLSIATGSQLTMDVAATGTGGLTFTGAGTLVWPNASTLPMDITGGGTLTGGGGLGALNVSLGTVQPTGGFETGNLTLGQNSVLIFDNANSLNVTGSVTLNNSVLLVFDPAGTVIDNDGTDAISGEFRSMPDQTVVDYQGGTNTNDAVLTGVGVNTVNFVTQTYTAAEGDGTVDVTLTSSGPVTVVIGSSLGGASAGTDFTTVTPTVVINGNTTVTINITDDLIAESTEVAHLVIIPVSGGFLFSPATATLTISDNDASDKKACGFGTGLTVFLLLGFGLLFHVRLRRS